MNIAPNIVKIRPAGKNSGSGFIHKIEAGKVYIFTARHVLLDDGEDVLPKINIGFYDKSAYTLQSGDTVIYGKSNTRDQDVALIIIQEAAIQFDKNTIIRIDFAKTGHRSANTHCTISGYPHSTREQHLRTLNQCRIVKDKDFEAQIQLETTDPIMEEYNVEILFQSYSGSGIFIETPVSVYACALVTSFETTTKRITGITPQAINPEITAQGLEPIEIKTVELDSNLIKDIEKLHKNTGDILNRINDKIGTIHINRNNLCEKIIDRIRSTKSLLIIGKAGTGKSAIIKEVLSRLSGNTCIIALKGEDIDRENLTAVASSLSLQNSLEQILNSPGLKDKKIILLDSFEKLLETDNTTTVFDFFSLINRHPDVTLIITCRSYAVEQLKIRYINVLQDIDKPVDMPILTDVELVNIESTYPNISRLTTKESIRKILKIPFILDKVINISGNILTDEITTEKQLKQVIWSYIIEGKINISNVAMQANRGKGLIAIARTRAKAMTSYVAPPPGIDPHTIQSLENDSLITGNNAGQYTPSHDIYEDWALTKHIETEYTIWEQSGNDIRQLFHSIGTEPAIRRAFRIWIHEKLQEDDFDAAQLITDIINDTDQHWIDETFIAIIQSKVSLDFLKENKSIFYADDFKQLQRFLLLLKVSGQEADYSLIEKFEGEEKPEPYQAYFLKPAIDSWRNTIRFIDDNLRDFDSVSLLIIDILLTWENILINTKVEDLEESKTVGRIMLHYFHSRQQIERYPYKACITLLFRLAAVIKDELEGIINNELILDLDEINRYESPVIKYALSWQYSRQLAEHLPETLINVMEKKWFYYPDKEKPKPEGNSIFDSIYAIDREPSEDKKCGVTDSGFTYYPASAYQTPVYHLLNHNPAPTLSFIVRLFNHSININKRYEHDITELKIEHKGSVVTQYGNQRLWNLYRQGTGFSKLLSCVLMALDKWLLEIARSSSKKEYEFLKELVKYAFSILIQSENVAITSVLASLAVAHPDSLEENVLTLLRTREFFQWDLIRSIHERDLSVFVMDRQRYPFQLKERQGASKLPHRKRHLEDLMLTLSLSEYRERIYEIIDNFYAANSTDTIWRIALNRMDFRKREVASQTDDNLVLIPKIDKDLQPEMDSVQKQLEADQPFLSATNWARNVYEKKKEAVYSEWQSHYTNSINNLAKGMALIMNSPGTLAAVGIRDLHNELNADEQEWCATMILDTVNKILTADPISFPDYNTLDEEPVLSTLPQLIKLYKNETGNGAKKMFFYSILKAREDHVKAQKIYTEIQNHLHHSEDEFLYTSLAGIVEYAKLERELFSQPGKLETETDKLITNLINNNIPLNHKGISFKDLNTIAFGFFFIPPDTTNPELIDFVKNPMLEVYIDGLQKKDSTYSCQQLSFDAEQQFEQFMSKFILNQPEDISLEIFHTILNCLHINEDFVKHILLNIIMEVDINPDLSGRFRLLWEELSNKNKEKRNQVLSDYLLLYGDGNIWNKSTKEWKPIHGEKLFFKDAISDICQIKLTSAFLSGVGFTETIPDGIHWLADLLNRLHTTILYDKAELYYTERLIQRIIYNNDKRMAVRKSTTLRHDFIYILDILINSGSVIAFVIREDFISAR